MRKLEQFILERTTAKDKTLQGKNGRHKAKNFAEVTTPIWLIDKQLDLLPEHVFSDLSKTVLDPCTGDGRYLMCYLYRRVPYISNQSELVQAVSTLHGLELQEANVMRARQNLYELCQKIAEMLNFEINEEMKKILENNIKQGDFIKSQFTEHSNRLKANKYAEYITGEPLRQYLADKVKKYAGEKASVFDGAAGSGQLEQFISPAKFLAVEIQAEACAVLAQNYPNAKIYNQSFFEFKSDEQMDCAVMNPPFSIKFKDLSDSEKASIQAEFAWKKSGVVDDIFVLKAMKYTKRFGFFILFLGVGYRGTEKTFRHLIGNQVVELNVIQNAFEDTAIDVMFLVLDKQKTDSVCHRELYDCKTKALIHQDSWTIDADNWERVQPPPPPKEIINPLQLEQQARQQAKAQILAQVRISKEIALVFEPDFVPTFNDWLDDVCNEIVKEKIA